VRVLLVHNRYRSIGGEERHLDLIEEWLPRVGVEVGRFEIASPDDASLLGRLRLGLTLAYRPAGARLLREVVVREKPDIVHFHNLFPLLTPAAVREARRQAARVVLTIHNYRFACPAGTLLRRGRIHDDCIEGSSLVCGLRNARGTWSESVAYGIALEIQRRLRLLHRWVDAFVAPSNFMAAMLARAGYPCDRIETIYHGTPVDDAPSAPGDYALFAGRLSPEKGVETLLAASKLAPKVPLVVAGAGPLTPLVLTAVGGSVTHVGQVAAESAIELRRRALVTIMPSACFEGQPYGALESMAVGTPLVASRLGGLAEVIDDGTNGVLVPPQDPAALAAAMEMLWSDRSRAAILGHNAWSYARAHFSLLAQTERLAGLYGRLLLTGPRASGSAAGS
jgi:glycosyltransferase involved in cell wall biosynthesis